MYTKDVKNQEEFDKKLIFQLTNALLAEVDTMLAEEYTYAGTLSMVMRVL